jgi:DNA transposition AAA+ family ATPase
MEEIKKQQITLALKRYCDRYESQKRAANSLKDVSAATVSQMLNGNWSQISDEMWRAVAAQTGVKDTNWEAVETTTYKRMTKILSDCQTGALVMGVTGDAGTGKTYAVKRYAESHRQVYVLCCNEYWNRKLFLSELLQMMGRDSSGYTVGEMMAVVVRGLKMQESPLIVLDEADKLSDQVLYFFISLYNHLEDECGIVLCATSHLEKRLRRGMKLNKKGYAEIWSRLGKKCVPLRGVTARDITAICEANGVTDSHDIDDVIEDSEQDLRRVKRKLYALRNLQSEKGEKS